MVRFVDLALRPLWPLARKKGAKNIHIACTFGSGWNRAAMGCYGCSSFAALFVIRHLPCRAILGPRNAYDLWRRKQHVSSGQVHLIEEGGLPWGVAQESTGIWISTVTTSWNEKVGGSWTAIICKRISQDTALLPEDSFVLVLFLFFLSLSLHTMCI